MKKDILTRPFAADQIKQRPGQHGKTLSYVDISAVIERLNEAFDHQWSFEVASHEVQEGEVVVVGKLAAEGVVKTAFGGSAITVDQQGRVVSLADDMKAAASDSLKKAASMFGIGLDLYGGNQNHAGQEQPRSQVGRPNGQTTAIGDRLTARQLAAIHAACRRNNVTRDALGDLLEELTGKGRVEQLTKAEASEIISALSVPSGNGNGNGAHA